MRIENREKPLVDWTNEKLANKYHFGPKNIINSEVSRRMHCNTNETERRSWNKSNESVFFALNSFFAANGQGRLTLSEDEMSSPRSSKIPFNSCNSCLIHNSHITLIWKLIRAIRAGRISVTTNKYRSHNWGEFVTVHFVSHTRTHTHGNVMQKRSKYLFFHILFSICNKIRYLLSAFVPFNKLCAMCTNRVVHFMYVERTRYEFLHNNNAKYSQQHAVREIETMLLSDKSI